MSAARSARDAARWARMHALLDTRPHIGKACPFCGVRMTPAPAANVVHLDSEVSRDHLVPVVRGGTDFPHNLMVVCRRCNDLKGELLLTEWVDLLEADADPRALYVCALLDNTPDLRRRCEAVLIRERREIEAAA